MADMTFNWPRLKCPRSMLSPRRPVGAEDIRDLQGGTRARAATVRARDWLQWTDHLAQDLGGDVGIERCGLELFVSEQHLDHADIHLLLEQVGGEAVAQRVHRDALVDARREGRLMHRAVQLSGAQGLDGVQARKQPAALEHLALSSGHSPPGAQPLQQHGREHGVAVLRALALFDAQRHALAVDVTDLERGDFAGAKAGAVGDRESRLVLQVPARG